MFRRSVSVAVASVASAAYGVFADKEHRYATEGPDRTPALARLAGADSVSCRPPRPGPGPQRTATTPMTTSPGDAHEWLSRDACVDVDAIFGRIRRSPTSAIGPMRHDLATRPDPQSRHVSRPPVSSPIPVGWARRFGRDQPPRVVVPLIRATSPTTRAANSSVPRPAARARGGLPAGRDRMAVRGLRQRRVRGDAVSADRRQHRAAAAAARPARAIPTGGGWVALHDPAGMVFCATGRSPDTP